VGGISGMEGRLDGVRVLVVVFGLAIMHWIEGLAANVEADSSFLLACFTLFSNSPLSCTSIGGGFGDYSKLLWLFPAV